MTTRSASFAIVTLGCPKNEADSDRLADLLTQRGHTEASAERADLVIVNTCAFIDAAKEESIVAILEACAAAHARGARAAAIGCLTERYRADIERELPEVDMLYGLRADGLADELDRIAAAGDGRRSLQRKKASPRPTHAYVKISDGCDRRCAYCAIPLIKGGYRAESPSEILELARAALERGARELILVGQDTSRWTYPGYGRLARLVGEIRALRPAPLWLRLLYLQPEGVDDSLLNLLARETVPYLDLPLQHASARILRAMRRAGDSASHLALLERAREAVPDVAVRSTFIVGFPGETEDDFAELCDFVTQAHLAVAGVFALDAQEGTEAAELPDQVPDELRQARAARLAQLIEASAQSYWERFIGRTVSVLIERGCASAAGEAIGRIAQQAPDVDGRTYVRGAALRRGALVRVRIDAVIGFDLVGTVLT